MKKQFRKFAFIASVLFASASLVSCDDDDPKAEETSEEINELKLVFSGTGLTTVNAKASDADADGIGFVFDPVTAIELKAGETYTLNLTFTNLLENEDVTAEIRKEADEHQVFFTSTNNVVTVAYDDKESDYISGGSTAPVGLKSSVTVNATAGTTGTLNIRLKHQPNNQKNGSPDSGEDDVDLTFNIKTI